RRPAGAVGPARGRLFSPGSTRPLGGEPKPRPRRLDEQPHAGGLDEARRPAPPSSSSELSPGARRMLAAIDELPEEEREVFSLVRIHALTHAETAEVLGVSAKTVQRRLNRALVLLDEKLDDLRPASER